MARKRIIVSGVVQGVGFRYFTADVAKRLGLAGFVRNLPDGRVEIEAEGEMDVIAALLDELRIGPRSAHIAGIDVGDLESSANQDGFDIRF